MRKSERNLLASIDAQIYGIALELLNRIDDDVVADLLVDILTVLTSLTINVNELKILLHYLKTENRIWKKHAVKLLNIFKNLPYRYGPDEFFNFPGRNGSGIVLPPIKLWPYQNGFTISTWFCIDPVANGVIEKEKPYLYWFCNSKGHGYTAHFVGNCLVISYSKLKEKTFQHCIQFEFKPREWYMITFTHLYQRWSKSSIHCYINGQLVSNTFFPWSIESADLFDKCYIGCTPDRNDLTSFSGQLSTFYLFSTYLEPSIVQGLYKLGPAYKSQFKFENESAHVLNDSQRRAMYDGKLMNSIVFNYNPVACEEKLVLQAAPKTNVSYFVHTAHAQMLSNVRSVITYSIYSTLHSVGGIQVFFPLFGQLDHQQTDGSINYNVCSILLSTLCELIERSYTIQHQMLNSKGFLAIGYHLEKVQMRLYTYLATEFVAYSEIYHLLQPISEIIQTLHTIKYFYWVVDPSHRSGFKPKGSDGHRPTREQVIEMRRYMLLYLKQLVISSSGTQEEELQAILNYLHTVHEDDNLVDVLDTTVNLMSEYPRAMVPAFDRRQGLKTVFKLLASSSEITRLQALKLLGFFLQRSTVKRKTDAMQPHNLFSLLADRLLLHPNSFTMATYNVLFEILVEKVSGLLVEKRTSEITPDWKIENPAMIKVIATLLRHASDNIHQYDIKLRFLDDLILLASASRDNRRTILQMSVWQDYLFGLAYVYPTQEIQIEITDRVFDLLKILLHHAIKFEYGGWRVWIDTLSILHGRITKEDYYRKVNQMVENMKDNDEDESRTPTGSQSPVDEQSISTPTSKDTTKLITESINNPDNQIFCANVVHIISQMADVLCNASGGLLPLLASATSASHEIELLEYTEGLSPKDALRVLKRVMGLSDLFILGSTANFSELEQEKSMPSGGILRQCLRLTMTTAVRNCMECRFQKFDSSKLPTLSPSAAKGAHKDPLETILELTYLMNTSEAENESEDENDDISLLIASFIKNPESVLQELDIQRLRAIIYRDVVRQDRTKSNKGVVVVVDDTKQSQFLALAIVYFASVLMVSRYRDIIETNQTNLSRQTSTISATPSSRQVSTSDVTVDTNSLNDSTTINDTNHVSVLLIKLYFV
ncbi:unnamed protein product [Rotaria magnacalcarata]|uniref:DUF4704 domain-containing protein n=1 Tax=Rotaria magnacalcarata TaxID=392030 RepID=A0A8S2LHS8_9BILA|nr:unnamed protein product [Rotaria magnacalcarata]